MTVEFKESFEKDLRNIYDKDLLQRLKIVVIEVEKAQNTASIPNLRKISGHTSYYRIRVGDYRVGLKIENNTVVFVRFLHRKEVYRYFP